MLEKFFAWMVSFSSPQVHAALITAFVTASVAFLVSLSQCSRVSTDNAILKHDTQNMAGKLRDQDTTILKLTTEKASLENRAAIADSIPLHVPAIISNLDNLLATEPTNRQQLLTLLYSVEALTNVLADASLIPSFALYLNATQITNGTVLNLARSRIIEVTVYNTSKVAGEQLKVGLAAPAGLDPTNLVSTGWTLQNKMVTFTNSKMTEILNVNRWESGCDHVVSGNQVVHMYPIQISTNFPYSSIEVRFDVYCARSKTTVYFVTLTF